MRDILTRDSVRDPRAGLAGPVDAAAAFTGTTDAAGLLAIGVLETFGTAGATEGMTPVEVGDYSLLLCKFRLSN